jgi:hypothetical protein
MRAIGIVIACALFASVASAQDDTVPARIVAPSPGPPAPTASATLSLSTPDPFGAANAERFAELRLGHREARNTEGIALLGFGLASVLVGGLAAGIGYQDERWVGFGIGTAAWGALNALFCLIFFDLDDHVLRDIESGRTLRGRELDQAREDWAASQYGTATTIAVNAGLDVFYILGGILLFVVADQMSPDLQWLEGYAIAMTAQGTGLLAFDVSTWIAAAQRGDATRTLFRDPEGERE